MASTVTFVPGLASGDALADHWLGQVTLRLRREVCWLWHERGLLAGAAPASGLLPPIGDHLQHVLDLGRYEADKRRFFAEDATGAYLTSRLNEAEPDAGGETMPGSFGWVARALGLEPVDRFVLALALVVALDGAAGTVVAACQHDATRSVPTPTLAQRLWDAPDALLRLSDPGHVLARHGLLSPPPTEWEAPLRVPAAVARHLLFPTTSLPATLRPVDRAEAAGDVVPAGLELSTARIRAADGRGMRLVPLVGARGAPLDAVAAACAGALGRRVAAVAAEARPSDLGVLSTLAWLRGIDLYVPFEDLRGESGAAEVAAALAPLPALGITLFVGLADPAAIKHLPAARTLPALTLPPPSYEERVTLWRRHLPEIDRRPDLESAALECARRFRQERDGIRTICRELQALGRPLTEGDVLDACRADADLGELAQPVRPRFVLGDLQLPADQTRQLAEVVAAARNLTTVHYQWGTARAFNEGGLTALFAGAPGTGKTMAAEAIATALGVPLYRIDLSQVVNKYIGETEKNLKRLFDAADAADVVLFFDEADSLFGKRTEVKDAHDRYANLEISYLLERMERFKGLAILATNRRRDLDEAFLRRLAFVVEFPLPGQEERLRIWKSVVPRGVDVSGLDLPFLARRFPLAGGHIRAIVFHACLQSGRPGGPRALGMPAVLRAVKHEYDKLDRALSLDQLGEYAAALDGEAS